MAQLVTKIYDRDEVMCCLAAKPMLNILLNWVSQVITNTEPNTGKTGRFITGFGENNPPLCISKNYNKILSRTLIKNDGQPI